MISAYHLYAIGLSFSFLVSIGASMLDYIIVVTIDLLSSCLSDYIKILLENLEF
jgi:hypothetical protein